MICQIHNKKNGKENGFTLVETMVAIFIFTILAFGLATLFTNFFSTTRRESTVLNNVDSAMMVTSNFINQIRVASVGNDGGYPINQASNTQIIFYSNYNQTPGILARIRYYLSTSTLYKGTIIPTGNPLSYNSAQEKILPVQNNIVNTGQPIFYYYNGNYNGSTSTPALTQPVNVNQITYIMINMNILRQISPATTTFNVSAGSSIRNLKTNLGN